jgi:hypothetical protein
MKYLLLVAVLSAALVNSFAQCTISTTHLPGGVVGQNYAQGISGSCGTKASWNRLGGYPPLGLNISGSYGSISGKPALAGLYYFQMQLKGSGGTAVQDFWITIVDPLTISIVPQAAPLPCGQQITASIVEGQGGTPPYKWSAIGLPVGLAMDAATGKVSGSAACQDTAYTVNVDVTVTDSGAIPLLAKLEMKF